MSSVLLPFDVFWTSFLVFIFSYVGYMIHLPHPFQFLPLTVLGEK
jgi:hypothetical protein